MTGVNQEKLGMAEELLQSAQGRCRTEQNKERNTIEKRLGGSGGQECLDLKEEPWGSQYIKECNKIIIPKTCAPI